MSAPSGNNLRELITLLSAIASQEDAVQHAICAVLGSTASSEDPSAAVSRPPSLRRAPSQWPRALGPARQRPQSGRRDASASNAGPSLGTLALGLSAAWLPKLSGLVGCATVRCRGPTARGCAGPGRRGCTPVAAHLLDPSRSLPRPSPAPRGLFARSRQATSPSHGHTPLVKASAASSTDAQTADMATAQTPRGTCGHSTPATRARSSEKPAPLEAVHVA